MKNAKKLITLVIAMTVAASSAAVFADEAEKTGEDTAVVTAAQDETAAVTDGNADETKVADSTDEKADETDTTAEDNADETAPETVDAIKVETANLGDFISDKDNWGVDSGKEITFEGGKLINNNEGTMYIAYKNDNYANKLVQYKQTFDFAEGSAWGGFVLNASSYSSPVWSGGRGYLVVIKHDQIELQRWGKSGQKFLAVIKNDFVKDKTAANISAGAVNVNGGVNIFMFVDGVCVLNCFDSEEDAITEVNYFTLYETKGSEVEAFDGDAIPAVPAALKLTGKANAGEKYTVSTINASFGSDVEEKYTYEWFFNSEESGKLNETEAAAKEEFGSKYVPAGEYEKSVGTGETHTVAADEVGGYYLVSVKDSKGNVVLKSAATPVNNFDFIISNSVVLRVDCEYSYVKGLKSQIDPEDYNVAPTIVDSRTLVPVRFVAESFGADVKWDNDTKKITIDLGGKQIVMTLNEKAYTVDGKALELDVPAQVMYDRTMVPVRVISEAFGKTVFWDAENELIVISDEDLGIDSETEAATLSFIQEKIIKRL
ncbi:MAG: copper amine oxidase N-terminal domain-containing protein [Clostridia bacterium]|nr:copper amine oxidase N-terminal domain-containing protein [Clostridia bacterium]